MFTKKPIVRYVRTRQDYLDDRNEKQFFLVYAIFFTLFILIIALVRYTFAEEPDSIETIHQEICQVQSESPLCTDFTLLERIDSIASKKRVPTRLVIGIWNAESTLGTHFNKPICANYHNWAGLKGRKFDDGHIEMYALNRKKPDQNGCYLYKFDSIEQATESLVNTISVGYKLCNNKTECIAYDYVGKPDVAEKSWIRNVEKFYPGV